MAWIVGNMYHYRNGLPDNAEYVGRPPWGEVGSPLANPFVVIGKKSAYNLTEVEDPVLEFRKLLFVEMRTDTPMRREIDRLARMEDGLLICWCSPRPCHASVIAACIEWYRKEVLGVQNDVQTK